MLPRETRKTRSISWSSADRPANGESSKAPDSSVPQEPQPSRVMVRWAEQTGQSPGWSVGLSRPGGDGHEATSTLAEPSST